MPGEGTSLPVRLEERVHAAGVATPEHGDAPRIRKQAAELRRGGEKVRGPRDSLRVENSSGDTG